MNGSGCKNCPVKECETLQYRGSICAAQRAKLGLGDPMTNADRIRDMSDEELAEFICGIRDIEEEISKYICGYIIFDDMHSIKEWLEESIEEE